MAKKKTPKTSINVGSQGPTTDNYNMPSDTGYDQSTHKVRQHPGHNAIIRKTDHDGHSIGAAQWLWVNEISTDFSLGGSEGQSKMAKSFFPRNFTQHSYSIQCQAPSLRVYGDTINQIHTWQRECVLSDTLIQFIHYGGGYHTPKGYAPSNRKGRINCLGYVGTVQRRYVVGDYAPTFQINFIVLQSREGVYTNAMVDPGTLKTWKDLIKGTKMVNVSVSQRGADKSPSPETYPIPDVVMGYDEPPIDISGTAKL